ncbi:hypothetical protein AgCh_035309 [Apium graveolens]
MSRETGPHLGGGRFPGNDKVGTAFDLVKQMHYLFVSVVKAKEHQKKPNDHFPDPYIELQLGNFRGTTKYFQNVSDPEWIQVFAILKNQIHAMSIGFSVKKKYENNKDCFIENVCLNILRFRKGSHLIVLWHHSGKPFKLVDDENKQKRAELLALLPHSSEVFIGALPRGFAFVSFNTKDVAQKATEQLHSKDYKGGTLRCSLSETKCRLFIGDVPKNLTDDEVKNLIDDVGPGAKYLSI